MLARGQPSAEQIDRFWESTQARLAKEPLDLSEEEVKEPLPYRNYRVTYRSWQGVQVRAYLYRPILGELA